MTRDRSPDGGERREASAGESGGFGPDAGDGEPADPARSRVGPLGRRARTRLGVSRRQWTWLVALLVFVPYPVFVALFLTYPIDEGVFLAVTLVVSILLAALELSL